MEWRPRHNKWLIAITVSLATFMESLDYSISNVALPHIAGGLSAGLDASTWVLTSYFISNAVMMPISAWMALRMGRKRFYMACVALFGVSSLLCGLAPSLGLLIFFRVLQGAGGGGLIPSEQAILADTFPPKKLGMAFAVYGLTIVMGSAIGPTIGGYITDNFDWRWIFFINVPVVILSLVLTSQMVEDPPYLSEERKSVAGIDYLGLALISLGLGCLQVVLDRGQREDWFSSNFIVSFAVLAAAGILGALFWEHFHPHPIIDISLFRNRTFALSFVMMFMMGFALYGTTVLMPQLTQTLMGYPAQTAGMMLAPGGFTTMLIMPIAGFLVSRRDPRLLAAFGFFMTTVALWQLTTISLEMDFWTVVKLRVFQSAGIAWLFIPISTMAHSDFPGAKNNSVSGLTNLARNIGGSVGISAVTTLLARRSQYHQNVLLTHVSSYDAAFQNVSAGLAQALNAAGTDSVSTLSQAYQDVYLWIQRQASILSYIDVAWLFAICVVPMVPMAFLIKRPSGGHVDTAHAGKLTKRLLVRGARITAWCLLRIAEETMVSNLIFKSTNEQFGRRATSDATLTGRLVMRNSKDRQHELLSILHLDQPDPIERSVQNSEQRQDIVPISPQSAFEEFVEDHAELLRRLAL